MTAVLSGISAFMVFDMVYNEIPPSDFVPGGDHSPPEAVQTCSENTMAAIKAANDEMADYSEIDVQLSEDGVPVVRHDLNPGPWAGVDVSLKNLLTSWSSWMWEKPFQFPVAGEYIPSLEEVLKPAKDISA